MTSRDVSVTNYIYKCDICSTISRGIFQFLSHKDKHLEDDRADEGESNRAQRFYVSEEPDMVYTLETLRDKIEVFVPRIFITPLERMHHEYLENCSSAIKLDTLEMDQLSSHSRLCPKDRKRTNNELSEPLPSNEYSSFNESKCLGLGHSSNSTPLQPEHPTLIKFNFSRKKKPQKQCADLDAKSTKKSNVADSDIESNGNGVFPCPRVSCPAVFYNASSLGSHVNSIHKEEPEESTCAICGDYSEGRHYGVKTCQACKGFFKRFLFNKSVYSCSKGRDCDISKLERVNCKFCRLQKCIEAGMIYEGRGVGKAIDAMGLRKASYQNPQETLENYDGTPVITKVESYADVFSLGKNVYPVTPGRQELLPYPGPTVVKSEPTPQKKKN